LKSNAKTELASGVRFLAITDLRIALDSVGGPRHTAHAIEQENANARIDALCSSVSVIAVIALIGLFFSFGVPTTQPVAATSEAARAGGDAAGTMAGAA